MNQNEYNKNLFLAELSKELEALVEELISGARQHNRN